jgi:hypothetical protein
MKMVWESDVAGCGWRWINLIWVKVNDLWVKVDDLSIKVWIVRVEGAAKEQGELEKDGWSLDTSVKKNNVYFFFVFIAPLKPNWFGWGFSSFRFRFWNLTELKIYSKILIGLINFFLRFSFLDYFFLGLTCFPVLEGHARVVRSQNFSCLDQKVS